ncbi:uncharacterized protein LOC127837139 isoform X2 [Dreissena polymorpha]|uniref:uncharacterized protein LOC127837139 isoform X2 n=1 Tax=Dreissena polymorpha TaxID=45954 RepID=UPI00226533C7|nr:uncharacterized protein LOC127837139 isoform X2 [Dreissena polymorpha]
MRLVIGAEETGPREITTCLVKLEKSLDVLTCSSLPIPGERDLQQAGIQFICFVILTSNKESLNVVSACLSKVDFSYFSGRCVLVVNNKDSHFDEGIDAEIKNLARKFDVQSLYVNTQDESELLELGKKIVAMVDAIRGSNRFVTSMLFESMRVLGHRNNATTYVGQDTPVTGNF